MTCVVAICRGDDIWMGADSGAVDTSAGGVVLSRTPKVWRRGDIVFGSSGSYRAIQIVQHWLDSAVPSQLQIHEGSVESFMVTKLLPSLKGVLERHGFGESEDNQASMDSSFIVGAKGKLYLLQTDYAILDIAEDFYSIGSGSDAALGALEILSRNKRLAPTTILSEALKVAEKWNVFVRSPLVFTSTQKIPDEEAEDVEDDEPATEQPPKKRRRSRKRTREDDE